MEFGRNQEMETSDILTNHGNETTVEDDIIELHAHYDILTDENASSSRKRSDTCGIGLTDSEEAEVQEIILKAEREFYIDLGKNHKTPPSEKEKLVEARNHNSNSTLKTSGLLENQHGKDSSHPQSTELYSNYIQKKRTQNTVKGKEMKDFKVTEERNVGAKIQQKTDRDCEAPITVLETDGMTKLSEEDKAIMLDLVDIALGEKEISEVTVLANASGTNKKTREDIIKKFVKSHFKTLEVNNLQHKSRGNNGKDNPNCQSNLLEAATKKLIENIQHNRRVENSYSTCHVHAVTNTPPSTPEKVLTPVLEEGDEIRYPIGLSSAEEKEINEIIQLAERAYKGKIDTTRDKLTRDICKVTDEPKHFKDNIKCETMDTAEIDTNKIKEVVVNNQTKGSMEKATIDTEKEKSVIDTNTTKTETNKMGRQTLEQLFVGSNSQKSEEEVGRMVFTENDDNNGDTMNAEHDEGKFDRGQMKLPMNDKHGRFFINRSLFPVSKYQEGLDQKRWNPTEVLNELCTKLDWLPLKFGRMEYRPDQGFMVPVNINGREFLPTQWGQTKKSAKHLASTHFLNYLGFRFKYYDTSKYEVVDRCDTYMDDHEDLDEKRHHPNRNSKSVFNDRESCNERNYLSRSRRSVKDYERVRKPDPKKIRSEEFSFNLTSRSSIVHRGSRSIDRFESSSQRDSSDLRESLNLKNTLESLNLKDILKLKDSAVIVINNFERSQGSSRRRRHSTSSSSPSPRERSSLKQKQISDTPRTPSNAFRRPARWENVDDIKPFVPRNLYQDSEVSPRHTQNVGRSHQSRLVASRPQRCRCKPSFPHPSIHPWRTELGSSKYPSTEPSRSPAAHNASGRTLCSYGDLVRW